jgi:hypothetical protein
MVHDVLHQPALHLWFGYLCLLVCFPDRVLLFLSCQLHKLYTHVLLAGTGSLVLPIRTSGRWIFV